MAVGRSVTTVGLPATAERLREALGPGSAVAAVAGLLRGACALLRPSPDLVEPVAGDAGSAARRGHDVGERLGVALGLVGGVLGGRGGAVGGGGARGRGLARGLLGQRPVFDRLVGRPLTGVGVIQLGAGRGIRGNDRSRVVVVGAHALGGVRRGLLGQAPRPGLPVEHAGPLKQPVDLVVRDRGARREDRG